MTAKNVGFKPTTGVLNSPDNLAIDALGNIYIIEDAPNGSDVGGDIWFARDTDNDGVAESLDHFLSLQVNGSEATGMIFNPAKPLQFVVAVQHPASTNLENVDGGFGDAIWAFNVRQAVPPLCEQANGKRVKRGGPKAVAPGPADHQAVSTCTYAEESNFVRKLRRAGRRDSDYQP